jgi:Na+/H+ antiporter NhaD/arsenite permease-like protein
MTDPTHIGVLGVFALVYLGMFLGGLPRLKLDRTGVALLGAIAMIALTGMEIEEAAQAVDVPTIVLLFAFMVISAQMRLGGFYTEVTQRVGGLPLSPPALLGALIGTAGALSAVFSNDVICLAMTPVVIRLCRQQGLKPLPFLLGLACAANIGSAATLIGNPQNMLIGSVLALPFGGYAATALPPVLASLALLWAWLAFAPWGGGLRQTLPAAVSHPPLANATGLPVYDRWQSFKGLTVAMALMAVFLFTNWPHEVVALVGAGVLLLSRQLHSREVMGLVDWPLLLLFMGLFVVNHALQRTGMAHAAVGALQAQGLELSDPTTLMGLTVGLSNLVSNVPAVMLLLPHLGSDPVRTGTLLALVSTFAGNLLLIGSIANLIVADIAAREGIVLDGRRHLAVGLPVTVLSLGVAALWVGG